MIEKQLLNTCSGDDDGVSFFISDTENTPKCVRALGETCDPNSSPYPNDSMKLMCCEQPEKGADDNWIMPSSGEIATKDGNAPMAKEDQFRFLEL